MTQRFNLIIPALLATVTLIFFYELAFTDRILARGDTFAYFYPYWTARDAALRAGTLPLWSPHIFAGVPLLANSQIGTFYPPNWLTVGLDAPNAIRVSLLLHIWWAACGAYALARASLGVGRLAALTGALIFAFGGHVGGHIEQINQLQGLAWLPWVLWCLHKSITSPHRVFYGVLLAVAIALQFFSGHSQTVFITLIGAGVYALCVRPVRGVIMLALAGVGALILTAPQLIPTLEMSSVSNRRGGLNINQATAFSFSPFVTGRGLLPSFDRMIFSEYIAYPGVIGWGLALIGALHGWTLARVRAHLRLPLSPRATWLIIALVGLALAYGLYNPLYWLIGTLPGFNLFRVPARWLALFALGMAMLAALGVQALRGRVTVKPLTYAVIALVIGGLALASTLTLRNPDLTPVYLPETITLIGWGAALIVTLIGVWIARWARAVVVALVIAAALELFAAAHVLAGHQLVPPDVFSGQRFTVSQMLALNDGATPAGRMLSISQNFFDPGDRAALESRYRALGMDAEQIALAFDGIKRQELIAPNLPLAWGIPSFDGFDGGVLPTAHYTAFTSLMLPDGELRTIDGRLRENLARAEQCRGACIPDVRWLNVANIEYVIIDKVFDLVHQGVFYDTGIVYTLTAADPLTLPNDLPADALDVLCAGMCDLQANDAAFTAITTLDGFTLLRAPIDPAVAMITLSADSDSTIRALTLVNTANETFAQVTPPPFTRALSSDIKLYRNNAVLPRAWLVNSAITVTDDDFGTEDALTIMRDSAFDPAQTVILATTADAALTASGEGSAQIVAYSDTLIRIEVDSNAEAYLVLSDAHYPGWTVTINGAPAELYRANVMFRAVRVEAGDSEVVFAYRPAWLPLNLVIGMFGWGLVGVGLVLLRRRWAQT